jgi:sulfur-oxidizing protein SoxY
MADPNRATNRRDLLIASGTCALIVVATPLALLAQDKKPVEAAAPVAEPAWQAAMRSVTGDAKVTEGRITLEVPEIAENGNVVPFNVLVDSPMTDSNFVRSVRVYSTANPQPLIATFRFSADSGRAQVSSRFRLAATQDVVALAELGDGSFLTAKRNIKVTIGGCGG